MLMSVLKIHNSEGQLIIAQSVFSAGSGTVGPVRQKFINPPTPVHNGLLRVRGHPRKLGVSARGRRNNRASKGAVGE